MGHACSALQHEVTYDDVLGLVDTTSVWSIDLVYALQALGIPATYHTSYLGARREHADKVPGSSLYRCSSTQHAHCGRARLWWLRERAGVLQGRL